MAAYDDRFDDEPAQYPTGSHEFIGFPFSVSERATQTRLTALDLAIGTVDMDLGKESGEEPTPPFSRSGPERSDDDRDPLLRSAAPYVACNQHKTVYAGQELCSDSTTTTRKV